VGRVEESPPAGDEQEGTPSLGGEGGIDSIDGSSRSNSSGRSSSGSSGSNITSGSSSGRRISASGSADGGGSGSGSSSSSNSRSTLLEKAIAAAAVAALGAARGAARGVQSLWGIEEGRELEVSGQQACQSARATVKAWLREEEPEWNAWMAPEGRPSNQEAQEQLRRLRRQNRPGTMETAVKTMRRSVAKAVEAGKRRAQPTVKGTGKWQDLVADGEACVIWKDKCAQGAVPPSPFWTEGKVGQNGAFSLSAVREWLRWEKQQAKRRDRCGGGDNGIGRGDGSSSGVGSGCSGSDSSNSGGNSGSSGSARRAWPAGSTTSNAVEALAKFVKRKGLSGTPQVRQAQAVAAGGRVRETAEVFLERMRPAGERDTPAFVQRLKAGALDAAEDFWR
jgi:hypothetical protein